MTAKLFWREQIERWSLETLKLKIRGILGGYTAAINFITIDNLFFRAVPWDERPTTIGQISYPPAERVTKQGRVNRVGQPMFYASRGAPSVYFEVHAKQGQRLAVSTWEVVEPLWMHSLGYHAESLRRIGGPIDGERGRLVNPIPNETKFNEKLRRQLSEAFTEDVKDGQEHRYKLPIAINELLFDRAGPLPADLPNGPRSDQAGGTVFPTMRMRGAADNVAIKPEFVHRCLRLKCVSYTLVEAADSESLSYTVSSLAFADKFSGEEIIWSEAIQDKRRGRGSIAFETGHWVLRDGLNQIYDIHRDAAPRQ